LTDQPIERAKHDQIPLRGTNVYFS